MGVRGTAMLLMALASAPFQCSSEPDPSERMEETPGQALYELAEQFRQQGDMSAWRTTLRRLVARYPSSRYAKMAEHDLKEAAGAGASSAPEGEAPDASDESGAPTDGDAPGASEAAPE